MHHARIEVTVTAEVALPEQQFHDLLGAALSDYAGEDTKADAALYRLSLESAETEDEKRTLAEELINATLGRGLRNAARHGIAYACAKSHFGLALDGGPVLLEAHDPGPGAAGEAIKTEANEESAE